MSAKLTFPQMAHAIQKDYSFYLHFYFGEYKEMPQKGTKTQ
jgi:hypothetical protein